MPATPSMSLMRCTRTPVAYVGRAFDTHRTVSKVGAAEAAKRPPLGVRANGTRAGASVLAQMRRAASSAAPSRSSAAGCDCRQSPAWSRRRYRQSSRRAGRNVSDTGTAGQPLSPAAGPGRSFEEEPHFPSPSNSLARPPPSRAAGDSHLRRSPTVGFTPTRLTDHPDGVDEVLHAPGASLEWPGMSRFSERLPGRRSSATAAWARSSRARSHVSAAPKRQTSAPRERSFPAPRVHPRWRGPDRDQHLRREPPQAPHSLPRGRRQADQRRGCEDRARGAGGLGARRIHCRVDRPARGNRRPAGLRTAVFTEQAGLLEGRASTSSSSRRSTSSTSSDRDRCRAQRVVTSIVALLTFDEDAHTLGGVSAGQAASALADQDVAAIRANHGAGLQAALSAGADGRERSPSPPSRT